MKLNFADQKIINEYNDQMDRYEQVRKKAEAILNDIIVTNNFFAMPIDCRLKNVDSLIGKIKRKNGKYKSIHDITDILGFRIICYFSDTVDMIAAEIEKSFEIDTNNSIDKSASLEVTQFGYLSLHYICTLKDDEEYSDIPFEIQVRTVLQHAWAEIEHDLGYKSDFGVPKPIRREFSRIAGLLEIADNQFIQLKKTSNEYVSDVRRHIASGDAGDILLDKVSLAEYIRINTTFNGLTDKIAKATGVDAEYIDPDSYIPQFEWLGINTIGDLDRFVKRNELEAYSIIINRINKYELDIISTNMVLRYLCRAELSNGNYNKDQIRQFLAITVKREAQLQYNVDIIIDYIASKRR